MVSLHFVDEAGEKTTISVAPGTSLMMAAVNSGIGGIVGECGGAAMCATCHVHVDPEFTDKLQPRSEVEEVMLESAASPPDETSRLSCQIEVTDELDGLVVKVPAAQ